MGKELDAIRKKLGHLAMAWRPRAYLDTGLPDLNRVIGHADFGIPYGTMIEITGMESHGKTAIALSLSALAQVGGARVVWGDLENSWDEKWARARGLNPDKVELIQPYVGQFSYVDKKTGKTHQEKSPRLSTAQELCAEIEAVIKSPISKKIAAKQIGVIDSVASLLTEGEGDAGIENSNMRTNMDLPMFVGRLMRRWMACAQSYNTTFIFINQMRQKPGVKMGSPWYSPGGNAPRFYCQVRLRAKRTGFCKDGGKNVGIQGILKATKNKCGGEEGAEIGYRLLKGVLEFVPAKDVAYKKDGDGGEE
jgi:recombination protein RecA